MAFSHACQSWSWRSPACEDESGVPSPEWAAGGAPELAGVAVRAKALSGLLAGWPREQAGPGDPPSPAAGLVPEAVVVVLHQVGPLEPRVVEVAVVPGHAVQQAGQAPQTATAVFRPGAAGPAGAGGGGLVGRRAVSYCRHEGFAGLGQSVPRIHRGLVGRPGRTGLPVAAGGERARSSA